MKKNLTIEVRETGQGRMKDLPFKDISDSVLCTHQGCMDGSGVAILFKAAGGKEENIRFVPAGMVERFVKSDPTFASDKFIMFVDVNVTSQKYGDILEKRGNLVLIDHHQTAEHLIGRSWAHVSAGPEGGLACGTELFRQYLVAHGVMGKKFDTLGFKNFAKTIDDHDRWQQKVPLSGDLVSLFAFMGQSEFVRNFRDAGVKFLVDEPIEQVPRHKVFNREELFLIEQVKKRDEEELARLMRKVVVRGVTFEGGEMLKVGYLATGEKNVTELLQRTLTTYPEIDVACQLNLDKGTVSLRSRTGSTVDVSKIASYFKGGGHRHAAGHRLSDKLIDVIIDEVHCLEED